MKKFQVAGFLFFISVSLSACTSVHEPTSGFLGDYSSLQKGKNFKQERVAGGVDLTKYQKVKVEPVKIDRFQNFNHEYSNTDIQNLAAELQASLEKSLSKRYKVLGRNEGPDQRTLVIAPALVYATSPERVLNLVTFWFLFGFQFSKGSVAFEAKLIDGGSGREIAAVAEERTGGGGLLDIKSLLIGGFFRFIHAEGAFNRWGEDFDRMTLPPKKG